MWPLSLFWMFCGPSSQQNLVDKSITVTLFFFLGGGILLGVHGHHTKRQLFWVNFWVVFGMLKHVGEAVKVVHLQFFLQNVDVSVNIHGICSERQHEEHPPLGKIHIL